MTGSSFLHGLPRNQVSKNPVQLHSVMGVVKSSPGGTPVTLWGTVGDVPVPVPADHDGDGETDFPVFRDGDWFVKTVTVATSVTYWGIGTDTPIPA